MNLMTKSAYRGETCSKAVARILMWSQHRRLLKDAFLTTNHLFLASHTGKDAEYLLAEGVSPKKVCAVECDHTQYLPLMGHMKKLGYRLQTRRIEDVAEQNEMSEDRRSWFLDYCGTLEGTQITTRKVVACVPKNSVVSITVLRGRELSGSTKSRDQRLLKQLRKASPYQVSLIQTVTYISEDADTVGSAMVTFTFFIGDTSSKSKFSFNLTRSLVQEMSDVSKIRSLWKHAVIKATKRRQAAVQANVTRR